MRRTTKMLLIATGVLVAIQLIPVPRTNPDDRRGPGAPPEVEAVLRRACYDCHSHETVWPWYSRVAPASWLVAWDVHEAREHLNLSTLQDISPDTQAKIRAAVIEEVEEGAMPLWYYLLAHPEARISEEDLGILRSWR
ncbi:MAG: heme-binding protein [Acidimicrobiia bacterium]|nr:heme-binding protein [Acidimicrobiia bacterium]